MPESIIAEIWKPVVGYEGWYSVSNLGRVRRDAPGHRTKRGRILATTRPNQRGYIVTHLSRSDGTTPTPSVHSLVAAAFIGPRPPGYHVNHKNGNKADNRPENLEYVTPMENIHHAIRTGLNDTRGSEHGQAKLTESQVIEIRRRCAAKEGTWQSIAKEYGVVKGVIGHIIHRRSWTHC